MMGECCNSTKHVCVRAPRTGPTRPTLMTPTVSGGRVTTHGRRRVIKRAVDDVRQAMQRDDFYNVLGVERYATASEIRQAYRKLAIKYHPDKHANASEQHRTAMADAFREVQRAYEILSDEDKRRQYDLGQPIADGGFAYDDIEEAFLDIVRKTGQAMMRVPSQEVAVGSAVSAAIGALGGYVIGTITAWTSNRPGRQSYPALYSAMGLVLGASAPIIYSSVQQSLAEIEPSRRDLLVDLIHQILLGYAESRTGDPQDDTDDWR